MPRHALRGELLGKLSRRYGLGQVHTHLLVLNPRPRGTGNRTWSATSSAHIRWRYACPPRSGIRRWRTSSGLGVSLRDRAVGFAETPAYAGLSPFRAPYAKRSIMPSTRLYSSVRSVNRAISCARLGIIQDRSRIIQELSRSAILAAGENNNAFPIRERCELMVAQLRLLLA